MMSWRVDRKTRQIALTCTCYIGAQNDNSLCAKVPAGIGQVYEGGFKSEVQHLIR